MFQPPRVVRFVIAVTALVLAACTTTPQFTPKGKVVVPAQADAKRPSAVVHLSNEIVIELPRVNVPGNVWTLILNDARFLHQLQPVTMKPDGSGTVSFMAIRDGRRPIRFFAVPPGREVTPTQAYEIVITIE